MCNALDNYTFLPFSVFLAIFWIFTYKKVPETKNKTFEEILALFRHGNGRSMLNCVNALEQHLPVTEQAGLVVAEEKTQQDSFPNPFERRIYKTTYNPRRHSAYATMSAGSEHSSRAGDVGSRPPPPLPPPRFPNSAV